MFIIINEKELECGSSNLYCFEENCEDYDGNTLYFYNSISNEDKKELERLWFIYGNNGIKHLDKNHHFIQSFIDNLSGRIKNKSFKTYFEEIKKFYSIRKTDEIYKEVFNVLKLYL